MLRRDAAPGAWRAGGYANLGDSFPFPLQPPTGTDTMVKSGVSTNISTKHQCLTAMKEYESKSLEVGQSVREIRIFKFRKVLQSHSLGV